MRKVQNAEEMKLKTNFENLKKILLDEKFSSRMVYPLAFWTLPEDRRLPLSLLSYPLKKVLEAPFEELANTPGVGQKKLNSLVFLLQRAAEDVPPSRPITLDSDIAQSATNAPLMPGQVFKPVDANGEFDASLVSEALWHEWRETAETHNFGEEKLGRLAPSLKELPTVIWNVPLKHYTHQTLFEIRSLRTHGEKRVRVILEVFYVLHEMMQNAGRHSRLMTRIQPSFIAPLEAWFQEILARESLPSDTEIRNNMVNPLVQQLTTDAGADVVRLVRGRLGCEGQPVPVRQQSREMRVTRARIYQLLEECDRIMNVRWPEGRRYFQELGERFKGERRESMASDLFFQTYDLFYPRKYAKVESVLTETQESV
jgi:hypothetical protein